MYTVYQTHREGKELPQEQWITVRGVINFHTGGTKRSPHKVANVYDKDFKPLLGDLEHAVVVDVGNGRFAIHGKQKATHEKGMYWDKQWYLQVWGCVPDLQSANNKGGNHVDKAEGQRRHPGGIEAQGF